MEKCYVNYISYSRIVKGERIHIQCEVDGNATEVFTQIYCYIKDGSLRRLEMKKEDSDLSLSLFVEKDRFFVGTIDMCDDEVFFYTNGTNDSELIEIDGNVYEMRLVGTDLEVLCDIIEQFAKDGTRSVKAQWIEDER